MEQEGEVSGSIEPPLFVFEGGDLTVFATVGAAESKIEGIDASEYVGFDSQGTVLHIEGLGVEDLRRWVQVGATSICSGSTTDRSGLECRLRQFVASVGPERLSTSDRDVSEMSLDELADHVARWMGPVS